MRFEIIEERVIFIKDAEHYTIPDEDIGRLLDRPSTRVLRLIDEKGEMRSEPIAVAIREIEGYQDIIEQFKA